MNERIRNFAKESHLDVYGLGKDRYQWEATLEKFAELIVRECVETLRLVPYNSDREFGDEVIYQDAVKQHFGVEL